jgi:hypothetical protein
MYEVYEIDRKAQYNFLQRFLKNNFLIEFATKNKKQL